MHLFSLVYIDTAEWSWRENKLCSGGDVQGFGGVHLIGRIALVTQTS
jgi:hypothetical protein